MPNPPSVGFVIGSRGPLTASAMSATAVIAIPIRTLSWVAVKPFSAGFSKGAHAGGLRNTA
jgi:hypothetical protein